MEKEKIRLFQGVYQDQSSFDEGKFFFQDCSTGVTLPYQVSLNKGTMCSIVFTNKMHINIFPQTPNNILLRSHLKY